MGRSGAEAAVVNRGNVYGSYIHGLFDSDGISQCIVDALYNSKGIVRGEKTLGRHEYREMQYDILADAVRRNVDMDMIYRIIEQGI